MNAYGVEDRRAWHCGNPGRVRGATPAMRPTRGFRAVDRRLQSLAIRDTAVDRAVEPRANQAPVDVGVASWSTLWAEMRFFLSSGFDMRVAKDLTLHPLHPYELGLRAGEPPYLGAGRLLGCYIGRNGSGMVLIDRTLGTALASEVLAHEAAHAWQARYCRPNQSELLREGFSQWVAFRYCGFRGYAQQLRTILQRPGPMGRGVRRVLYLEPVAGPSQLARVVRRASTLRELTELVARAAPEPSPRPRSRSGAPRQ